MSEPSWYLLFDGESADGMGPAAYVGRTMFRAEALEVTDKTYQRLPR